MNVLTFPDRRAVGMPKPYRKPRKAKRSNVLPFTGKVIQRVDGAAHLPQWKKNMVKSLTQALDQVLRDELTGLVLVKLEGLPTGDDIPDGRVTVSGAYSADLRILEAHAQYIEELACEEASEAPVLWV